MTSISTAATSATRTAPAFSAAGDNRTVRAIWPDGFLPIDSVVEALPAASASRARSRRNWDISTNYGTNALDYRTSNSVNVTLGNASPTAFYDGQLKFNQITTNLDLTTSFNTGLATPLKFATGFEFRAEEYTIQAGEPDSYRNGGFTVIGGPNNGGLAGVGTQVFPDSSPPMPAL
jgi:iron complex outermembrane receptor protein